MTARLEFLFIFLLFLLAVACGPDSKNNHNHPQDESPETMELKTGYDFNTAPDNEIKFASIRKDSVRVKSLTFKSSTHGYLVISKPSMGIGVGCAATPDDRGDYSMRYQFKLRNPVSGTYDIPVEPDQKLGAPTLSWVPLNPNDDVQIRVELQSFTSCVSASVYLTAVIESI